MTNDVAKIAAGLTKAQRRLVLALPASGRPKKWRAQYRHAKVRHWTQLPFRIANPTLDGRECLTDLGIAVRKHLEDRS